RNRARERPGMRVVERVWDWHFVAAPASLWPILADTARFNEAAGLPRYAVSDLPQPDGNVRRVGTASRFGFTLSWEEGVPQWVAGRWFFHERHFRSGPLRRVATTIELEPASGGGAQVRYRLAIDAIWPVALLLRLVGLRQFGRTLDRLFRTAAAVAE